MPLSWGVIYLFYICPPLHLKYLHVAWHLEQHSICFCFFLIGCIMWIDIQTRTALLLIIIEDIDSYIIVLGELLLYAFKHFTHICICVTFHFCCCVQSVKFFSHGHGPYVISWHLELLCYYLFFLSSSLLMTYMWCPTQPCIKVTANINEHHMNTKIKDLRTGYFSLKVMYIVSYLLHFVLYKHCY